MKKLVTATFKKIYDYKIPIILTLLFVAIEHFLYPAISSNHPLESIIVRSLAAAALSYSLIFKHVKNWDHYKFFKICITFAAIAGALLILILSHVSTEFVTNVAREDGISENLQALFLFIASLVMFSVAFICLTRKKASQFFFAFGIAIIFFVIGMEEISWMQRILEVQSNDFFMTHNEQYETNLHNISGYFFNQLYAVGAFILLTVLPYCYTQTIGLLKRLRLQNLSVFVPSAWLFLPFSVIAGFDFPLAYISAISILIFFFTVWMLIHKSTQPWNKKEDVAPPLVYLATAALITTSLIVYVFDQRVYSGYINTFREHSEFFISFGIMTYALDVYIKNRVAKSVPAKPRAKRA